MRYLGLYITGKKADRDKDKEALKLAEDNCARITAHSEMIIPPSAQRCATWLYNALTGRVPWIPFGEVGRAHKADSPHKRD